MRGVFEHDYDSQNFIRYVSREAKDGVYTVIYLEKNFRSRIEDRETVELIVSEATAPAGSIPGLEPIGLGRRIHTEAEDSLRRPFEIQGTETGRFSSVHPRLDDRINSLQLRVGRLEQKYSALAHYQRILFKAVQKLINKLGWNVRARKQREREEQQLSYINKSEEELPF